MNPPPAQNMSGKTVVITGATSGIGQVAAESLARTGARIVQIARDRQRGEAALTRLRQLAPSANHNIHYADLSRIREMKRVAAEIAAAEPRVDILINNAGAMFGQRQLTEDGLEITFALNHMAYFVLTQGLRERLVSSSPRAHRQHVFFRPRVRHFGPSQSGKAICNRKKPSATPASSNGSASADPPIPSTPAPSC